MLGQQAVPAFTHEVHPAASHEAQLLAQFTHRVPFWKRPVGQQTVLAGQVKQPIVSHVAQLAGQSAQVVVPSKEREAGQQLVPATIHVRQPVASQVAQAALAQFTQVIPER